MVESMVFLYLNVYPKQVTNLLLRLNIEFKNMEWIYGF